MSDSSSTLEPTTTFGELRSLVNQTPNEATFGKICELLKATEEQHPGLYQEQWASYIESNLASWPSQHRTVNFDMRRHKHYEQAPDPWVELVHGLRLTGIDLSSPRESVWLAENAPQYFSSLTHLTLAGVYARKREFKRLCDAGVFDTLTSISLDSFDLHLHTLGMLLNQLDKNPDLRSLGLANCKMTPPKIERLCFAKINGQLERLDLSKNPGISTKGVLHLLKHAPRFKNLTDLDLYWSCLSSKNIVSLVHAQWPNKLEYLSVDPQSLNQKAFDAMEKAGLLHSLVQTSDRGLHSGRRTLDLRYMPLEEEGFSTLMSKEFIKDVEAMVLPTQGLKQLGTLSNRSIKLTHLSFDYCDISEHMDPLFVMLNEGQVEYLEVHNRRLGDDFFERLTNTPGAVSLKKLSISGNFGKRTLQALLAWDHFPKINLFGLTCWVEEADPFIQEVLAQNFIQKNLERLENGVTEVALGWVRPTT